MSSFNALGLDARPTASSSSRSGTGGSTSSIEYVPSAAVLQAHGATVSNVSDPLALRKAYEQKQHSDIVRSLDMKSHQPVRSPGSSSSSRRSGDFSDRSFGIESRRSSVLLKTAPTIPTGTSPPAAPVSRMQSSPTASRRASISTSPTSPRLSSGFQPLTGSIAGLNRVSSHSPSGSPAAMAAGAESIKLQRVPTSVRIAQSLHPMSLASMSGPIPADIASTSKSSSPGSTEHGATVTPVGSRTQSPSGSSGTANDVGSDFASERFEGYHPRLNITAQPLTASSASPLSSAVTAPSSTGSGSAYSPLFDPASLQFGSPSTSPGSSGRRERSRTHNSSLGYDSSQNQYFDSGYDSPTTSTVLFNRRKQSLTGLATASENFASPVPGPAGRSVSHTHPPVSQMPDNLDRDFTRSVAGRKSSHRTSIVPGATPTTDEYARIIMQSRTAKMRKWAHSRDDASIGHSGTISGSVASTFARRPSDDTASYESGQSNSPAALKRHGIPDFRAPAGAEDSAMSEADITDPHRTEGDIGGSLSDGEAMLRANSSGVNKEIEWVDWLDEYRKLKEAKLLQEQAATQVATASLPSEQVQDVKAAEDARIMPPPPLPNRADAKGKARAPSKPASLQSLTFC